MERQRSSRGPGALRALALAGSIGALFGAGPVHAQSDSTGILKICKVAGPGVAVGTQFTFNTGGPPVPVPAGPPPGGYCKVGPTFPQGTIVTVQELIPPGYAVSNITVAPPNRQFGPLNLPGGSVKVQIGPGVTEVTFTDARTGFLEICKQGHVAGPFTFTVNPGALGPFTVPAGACSPPIQVIAGQVSITEQPKPGVGLVACATIPAGNLLGCNLPGQTATVIVAPGDVSAQTIAIFSNAPKP